VLYVDDGIVFGHKKNIDSVLEGIAKHFDIKKLGPVKKYLGFELVLDRCR
jgi:hypothetical protein